MDIITFDAETFWSQDYTLSKLSPLEYVLDPQFELICGGFKINNDPPFVLFGADAEAWLRETDFSNCALLGHNMSGFDAYILAYRYGIRPKVWMCTMAMARPLHAKTCGVSLAKLVEHYRIGKKEQGILIQTRGRQLADFTAEERRQMEVYNKADTDQCRDLFDILRKHHSASEMWQIDALTRMRTEPAFELDIPLLETTLSIERDRKLKALLDLAKLIQDQPTDATPVDFSDEYAVAEAVRSELASAPKFGALLESLGVAVPMKPSPTDPKKQVPALAKTDEQFVALQSHRNPLVAAAARARLDVKSTLLETRIEKFLTAGRLAGGRLPIPVKFCGADTTGRDSGEEYNPQNMPRINPDKPKLTDSLRRSLRAPKGMKVIVADQSGIELRVNHFLWKVPYSTELWRNDPKGDVYRASYAIKLGCSPEEVTKEGRQASKIENLGLGFGMGPPKYQDTARRAGMVLGIEQAELDVIDWRRRHVQIVEGWRACHDSLNDIARGVERAIDPWGLTHTCAEGIRLPSGRLIRYPDLRQEKDDDGRVEWWYGQGRHTARIYAGKIDENMVQALARDSIFDCAVEFYRLTGLRPALRVHDELVYVVPENRAEELLALLQTVMRTPPRWWRELVVWSEGDCADTYGDAK